MTFAPNKFVTQLKNSSYRAFQHRDFRYLWVGAFFSFVGSWIQNVAQGYLVYEMTGDKAKLAFVMFVNSVPSALLGPFAGAVTDTLNRRRILVVAQICLGVSACVLAAGVHFGWLQYWHVLAAALFTGLVNCVETPTRQSIISAIVPPEDLAAAVPINAMTFNLARVLGPAIGGILLAHYGAKACFFVNGLSYLALVYGVVAIRSDISSTIKRVEPIRDVVMEGMLYTWREIRLRTLFLMEITLSMFGLIYIPLMPAIAKDMLGLKEAGLGAAMTWIGVGAMIGLITLMVTADKPIKSTLARVSMTSFALSLLGLTFCSKLAVAAPFFVLMGISAIMQFNITNTLFQLLSPPKLRGRVIAMHVWALSGFSTITNPVFGWIANHQGLRFTLQVGAVCVLAGAILSWIHRSRLPNGVEMQQSTP